MHRAYTIYRLYAAQLEFLREIVRVDALYVT